MHAGIVGAGVAATVTKKAGQWLSGTGDQFSAEHVAVR